MNLICTVKDFLVIFKTKLKTQCKKKHLPNHHLIKGKTCARVWIFIAFLMSFGSLIASIWIFFAYYVDGIKLIHIIDLIGQIKKFAFKNLSQTKRNTRSFNTFTKRIYFCKHAYFQIWKKRGAMGKLIK